MADAPEAVAEYVGKNRGALNERIAAYAGSELLCYRADDPELAELQQKIWHPLLDWCAERFQAPLKTGAGIMPIEQPRESLRVLRGAIEAYDNARFAILFRAIEASGSLVIGLALAEGRIDAAEAFEAAELDAIYQMKKWGEDEETRARRDGIRRELESCEREFVELHRG